MTSVARRTSSLTSVGAIPLAAVADDGETGTAPADVGAEVIRWRRTGRLVQVLIRRLSRDRVIYYQAALKLATNLLMHLVTGKRQARDQQPVHTQADNERRQLNIQPYAEPRRQPGKHGIEPPNLVAHHGLMLLKGSIGPFWPFQPYASRN
jgi:hypothetical protein